MTECDHNHGPKGVRRRRPKSDAKNKPMRFVSLHHHSTYSSLDGFQLPEAHVRRVRELGMSAIAMTEHGNISSHDALEVAAKAQGVKPIYGCELYTGHTEPGKRTQKKYHLTVIAKNPLGYQNLLQLVTRSWREGFHYEPTVSWQMLRDHRDGLVVLSGCQGSLLFCSAVGGKLIEEPDASYRRAKKVAIAFKRMFGDSYFIEVQAFPGLDKTRQFNPMAERLGSELGIGLVATMDCHYTVPEEAEIQKVLHNVRGAHRQTLEEQVRDWGYTELLCPPANDRSIYNRLIATGLTKRAAQEAVINTELIAQECQHYDLPTLPMVRFPIPDGHDTESYWRHLIREGWNARGIPSLPPKERAEYKRRIKRESDVIRSKDFFHYFFMTADWVQWAKNEEIPIGPARGSAAASVVCYLLRITEIDPVLFPQLVFERFIDESRSDLPDIDLDLASWGRPMVRDYLASKYGPQCVSSIGTFTTYKPRVALNDAARVHKIPPWATDIVKNALIDRGPKDPRAHQIIEDIAQMFPEVATVFDDHPKLRDAMQLEGNIRNVGVHPAGLVVSNGPIHEICAVYTREVDGETREVVSLDKEDAERRGLIKMDALGLSTMNMIGDAVKQIGLTMQDMYAIDTGRNPDPKILVAFERSEIAGIFQYDGDTTKIINSSVKPSNFDEVCDVNALSRPGPLHSGGTEVYTEIKHGKRKRAIGHPAYERIVSGTKGQLVYQEQIMRVAREIGGFDGPKANYVRKCISNKLGRVEFDNLWDDLWEGAQRLHPGMSEAECRKIWNGCITAGQYAFNFAHTISYSTLAFWCMWLKINHPAAFYAASLNHMPDEKHAMLRRDATSNGIKLLAPSVSSEIGWTVIDPTTILAGFKQFDGFGDVVSQMIVDHRDMHGLNNLKDVLNIKGIGPKKLEKLMDLVDSDDPFGIFKIDNAIKQTLPCLKEWGLPTPTHKSLEIPFAKTGKDTPVVWIGVITEIQLKSLDIDKISDRTDLRQYLKLTGYDGEEQIRVKVSRFKYQKLKETVEDITKKKDLVLIKGIRRGWRTAREIDCENMWVIEL